MICSYVSGDVIAEVEFEPLLSAYMPNLLSIIVHAAP